MNYKINFPKYIIWETNINTMNSIRVMINVFKLFPLYGVRDDISQ